MAEELKNSLGQYKIWKNPANHKEPIVYLGEFLPPNGQFYFTGKDLKELGFGPGSYTMRAPEAGLYPKSLSKWQTIRIPND